MQSDDNSSLEEEAKREQDQADYDYGEVVLPETSERPSQRSALRRNFVVKGEGIYGLSYHPGRVMAYSPPRQRQFWGEAQSLPRVDWGDLFFDLHYVAATYNISYILVYDPTWKGLLYAAGTFFPVQMIWTRANARSSRFVTEDDLYHRALQIATLVVLATAVLHIRPVEVMSYASAEISMFVFCLCLLLEDVLEILKCTEQFVFGVGQTVAIRNAARFNLFNTLFTMAFHVPALVVATLEFFPRAPGHTRRLAGDSPGNDKTSQNTTSSLPNTDVPIILVLVGYWVTMLATAVRVIFFFPKHGKHKEIMVPMHVGFYIHRYGEWTMLMLGEGLFSLVIVDVPKESRDFFFTFYCGITTIIVLCYVHFQSQPHDPNCHALRRSKDAGVVWGNLASIFSFALVCLGAAFTFFLTFFAIEDGTRRLATSGGADDENSEERSAHLFCGSLAVIFVCLDGMTLLHVGWEEGFHRLEGDKTRNIVGVMVLCTRLAIIVFIATASQWQTDPSSLAVIGLLCSLGQLIFRKLGDAFLTYREIAVSSDGALVAASDASPRHFRQSVLLASAGHNLAPREKLGGELASEES